MATGEGSKLFKMHSDFCSALANEKRLQIFWHLSHREFSVGELAKEMNISTPNVSQHLRVLRNQAMVVERKVGQQVYYKVDNKKFIEACTLIREGILETQLSKSEVLMTDNV